MNKLRQFSVDSWCAWAPGLVNVESWQNYFAAPYALGDESADVSFMPAMQRRRLSPLARAAFYASYHCLQDKVACPAIYCSSYGEYQRAELILRDIAANNGVSPTAFGLSVHNAIAGQASIYFDNKEPMLAIAPAAHDYLSAFVDALGFLAEGKSSVLVVFYEENAPEFFAPDCFSADFPCALALRLSLPKAGQPIWALDFNVQSHQGEGELPELLQLIRFFAQANSTLKLGHWQLS